MTTKTLDAPYEGPFPAWFKFPSGKVWRVDEKGWISGSVVVPQNDEDSQSYEYFLDQVSEAATGSSAGLENFSYRGMGDGIYLFSGDASHMLREEFEEMTRLGDRSDELIQALQDQYQVDHQQALYMCASLRAEYENECVIDIAGSNRTVHCPAYPQPCTYVRIVVDGFEVAYWDEKEWGEAPAEVMGAIMGAMRNQVQSEPSPPVSPDERG